MSLARLISFLLTVLSSRLLLLFYVLFALYTFLSVRKRIARTREPFLAGLRSQLAEWRWQVQLEVQRRLEQRRASAETLNNLGLIQQESGDYEAALRSFREAIDIGTAVSGEEDPFVTVWISNYGLLLHKLGNHAEADKRFLQVLNIRKKTLGEQHEIVAEWLTNWAYSKIVLGPPLCDYSQVSEWISEALSIRRALGNDEKTADSLNDLATICLLRAAEAEGSEANTLMEQSMQYGTEACKRYEAALGAEHDKTKKAKEEWLGLE